MRLVPAIWRILNGTPQLPGIMNSLSLRQNFSWTMVGNVIYAACQWGVLVVLAKLGTPETVGQFTLGLAITAPIILFSNLQLRAIQATDVHQNYRFSEYLQLRLITTAIAMVIIVGLACSRGGEAVWVILLIGLAKAIESLSDIFYGSLQQHEQMQPIALSMIFRGVLSLGALGSVMSLTQSITWSTAAFATAWAIVFFVYDAPNRKITGEPAYLLHTWNLTNLIKLAQVSLPLGFVMMFVSLNANIPRYFIEHYLGQRELGFFSAIAYLQVAGTTIVAALGQAASPRLAKYYVAGNRSAFQGLLTRLMGIGALLGGGGIVITALAGKPILTLMYRAEYAEHTEVFLWLMVATGISYLASFLGYGMTAAQRFKDQFVLFSGITLVVTLTSIWLIPIYALKGSALVFVISAIVQFAGSAVVMAHICNQLEKGATHP